MLQLGLDRLERLPSLDAFALLEVFLAESLAGPNTIEAVLDGIDKAGDKLEEMYPDPETWGTGRASEAARAKAEDMFRAS